MIEFKKVLEQEKTDWIVVVGDVKATLVYPVRSIFNGACSVAARKLHINVCHIEAGLRSGDERMPEEINRLVTDRLSNLPCLSRGHILVHWGEITKHIFNRGCS